MIVTEATRDESPTGEPSWRVVTQPDHARFAFELLRLWRGPELANHPRREDILFAAREHDNGWRELDAAPLWNAGADDADGADAAGRPHDFRSMPARHRIDLWLRGTERFADSRPYSSLLITLHALALNSPGEEDGGAPAVAEQWDKMIATLEERRDDLLEETGASPDEARGDYRFVRFADTASLTALGLWGGGFELDVPGPSGDGEGHGGGTLTIRGELESAGDAGAPPTLRLAPLPLAGATTFRLPARYLERRDYGDDVSLAVALATARWGEWRVRVAGAG